MGDGDYYTHNHASIIVSNGGWSSTWGYCVLKAVISQDWFFFFCWGCILAFPWLISNTTIITPVNLSKMLFPLTWSLYECQSWITVWLARGSWVLVFSVFCSFQSNLLWKGNSSNYADKGLFAWHGWHHTASENTLWCLLRLCMSFVKFAKVMTSLKLCH